MILLKIIAIIQARTGSKRLPSKVLLPLCGKPVICWIIDRVKRINSVNGGLIATTTNRCDDSLEKLCVESGVRCLRGANMMFLTGIIRQPTP